ncbi:hypothetical protein LINGRAHAP2_LOCUS33124, partial [Linum grandiflorum]
LRHKFHILIQFLHSIKRSHTSDLPSTYSNSEFSKMRFNKASAAVWDESVTAGSLTPKLSLFLLPSGSKKGGLRSGPPSTPPPNSFDVSVPFKWEEAPGKPSRQLLIDYEFADSNDVSVPFKWEVAPRKPRPRRQLVIECDFADSNDVSVPFKWEEAPGKPRPRRQLLIDYFVDSNDGSGSGSGSEADRKSTTTEKGLKLPPRLLSSSSCRSRRVSNMPSPPEVGFEGETTTTTTTTAAAGLNLVKRCSSLRNGSKRWGNLMTAKLGRRKEDDLDDQAVNFDSVHDDEQMKNGARIIRMRRRSNSMFNLSAQSRLANMYKSFKQVVIPGKKKRITAA